MTDFTTDDALGAALVDLGAHLRLPDHSMSLRVRAELHEPTSPGRATVLHLSTRRTRVFVVCAAAVLVLLVVTLSNAPARRAVANFFGIGSTGVVRVDELPPGNAPTQDDELPRGGDQQRLRDQLARAGLGLPAPELVGPPRAWHVDPSAETVVAFSDVVLGQRREGEVPAVKRVPPVGRVESTTVDGQRALWVEGPHVRDVVGRRYRSASALLWVSGGIELRLEGDLDLAAMRRIAESVAPVA